MEDALVEWEKIIFLSSQIELRALQQYLKALDSYGSLFPNLWHKLPVTKKIIRGNEFGNLI